MLSGLALAGPGAVAANAAPYGWSDDGWLFTDIWQVDGDPYGSSPLSIRGSGEISYTPPGTAYVTAFQGVAHHWATGGATATWGIRLPNGQWADSMPVQPNDTGEAYYAGSTAGAQAVVQLSGAGSPDDYISLTYFGVDIDDPDVPTVTSASSGVSGWVKDGVRTATVAGTDAGVGVKQLDLLKGTQVLGSKTRICQQQEGLTACPQALSGTINYDAGQLPEGVNTLGVRAKDWTDKVSSVSTFPVKVDRSNPTIALSGPLFDNVGQDLDEATYNLHVVGADSLSGVQRIRVLVGGNLVHEALNPAAGDGEGLTTDYAFPTSAFPDGNHTVTVEITDRVGNTATQSIVAKNTQAATCVLDTGEDDWCEIEDRYSTTAGSDPDPLDLTSPDEEPADPDATLECIALFDNDADYCSDPPSLLREDQTITWGMADERHEMFDLQLFKDLTGVKIVRKIVSWNLVDLNDPNSTTDEFDRFKLWYQKAAKQYKVFVVLQRTNQPGLSNEQKSNLAPTVRQLSTKADQLTRKFSSIDYLAAWNEPNHSSQPTRGVRRCVQNNCKRGYGANVAGRYTAAIGRNACNAAEQCKVVAGELHQDINDSSWRPYLEEYLEGIEDERKTGEPRPQIWSTHPYVDIRRQNELRTSRFIHDVKVEYPSADIWLSEGGSRVDPLVPGMETAPNYTVQDQQVTHYVTDLAHSSASITHVIYYHFCEPSQWRDNPPRPRWDSGLMAPSGDQVTCAPTPRNAYNIWKTAVNGS
ncbi:hypothetical protein OJ997_19295 [Solirubrobacter phytolaccae]|uniref:Uncharacterized protein n=1 Tax=Solirubrobacter phytolaccae TaxID=1404360 RepID=A0A9X3S9B2_9ACTN|nr:hypothetical protein [Solirubrobacter phytolaccae]MDA0182463.1 hypothetical protein [Solirubrobacter phytolaccae]